MRVILDPFKMARTAVAVECIDESNILGRQVKVGAAQVLDDALARN